MTAILAAIFERKLLSKLKNVIDRFLDPILFKIGNNIKLVLFTVTEIQARTCLGRFGGHIGRHFGKQIVAKIENASNEFLVHEYIVVDTKFVSLSCL